jgi:sugar phosphate permease
MSDWRKTYWQGFNIAGKIVGVLFALFGIIFIVYGATSGGATFVIPGLIVAVLGILLVCARPYRPDERK